MFYGLNRPTTSFSNLFMSDAVFFFLILVRTFEIVTSTASAYFLTEPIMSGRVRPQVIALDSV